MFAVDRAAGRSPLVHTRAGTHLRHSGLNQARRNRVDADTSAAELPRERLYEAVRPGIQFVSQPGSHAHGGTAHLITAALLALIFVVARATRARTSVVRPTQTPTYARTHARTHAHAHTHTRTHAHTHTHTHTRTHTHTHTHAHTHTRTHTRTHAHTHTHLYAEPPAPERVPATDAVATIAPGVPAARMLRTCRWKAALATAPPTPPPARPQCPLVPLRGVFHTVEHSNNVDIKNGLELFRGDIIKMRKRALWNTDLRALSTPHHSRTPAPSASPPAPRRPR